MHKFLVFGYHATVGIKIGTKLVKIICKVRDIKSSTCRARGGIKISSWWQMDRVKNHRGLMCIDGCVCPFDVVPLNVSCSLIFSLFLCLFDFVVLMSLNRDGGSIKLSPQHLLNLSKVDLFVDEVCSPHSDGVWVTLVWFIHTKKGKSSSVVPMLFLFLCVKVYKLFFLTSEMYKCRK